MQYITTTEAAALLNVSPNTLRAWERRFGFPSPQRSPGGHRRFIHAEVANLRDLLQTGISINSAVSRARNGVAADSRALVAALGSYDEQSAERATEAALALRSVDRAIDEVILPALDEIAARNGTASALWAFASRWAAEWFTRAQRLFPAAHRPYSVVIADATRGPLCRDAPAVAALELLLVRGGARVVRVPGACQAGVGELVAARRADLLLVAGSELDDDVIARWVYTARQGRPEGLAVASFRRGARRSASAIVGFGALAPEPLAASQALLGQLSSAPARAAA